MNQVKMTDKEIEEQQAADFINAWNQINVYGGKMSIERIEREMNIDHGKVETLGYTADEIQAMQDAALDTGIGY